MKPPPSSRAALPWPPACHARRPPSEATHARPPLKHAASLVFDGLLRQERTARTRWNRQPSTFPGTDTPFLQRSHTSFHTRPGSSSESSDGTWPSQGNPASTSQSGYTAVYHVTH